MELPPFLLDHWLAEYEFRTPPPPFNLGSSTGPRWTLQEILALGDGHHALEDLAISYAPPDGKFVLREAIAQHHGVDPSWVVVTTGASEAISILFCLASKAGANVTLPNPAFPAFAAMAHAWRLEVTSYELLRDEKYRQTHTAVLRATNDRTVLALVNTPHNPTGFVMPRADVQSLAAALGERGVPLIVDEVYHPLYFREAQPSAGDIENVIVVSDMSKALSLAGLRLGWIIDSNAARRKRIIDARSYFTISSSPLNEAIGTHALRHRAVLLDRLKRVATSNLAEFRSLMGEVKDVLSWIDPPGGTTAFPWFTDGRDSRPFCVSLAEHGALVAPGDCFGRPAHMRVGFGAVSQDFGKALESIRQVLSL